jgi:hypothetical protein
MPSSKGLRTISSLMLIVYPERQARVPVPPRKSLNRRRVCRFSNLEGWLLVFWNRPNRYQKDLSVSQSRVRRSNRPK